jgi:hypothetical protein
MCHTTPGHALKLLWRRYDLEETTEILSFSARGLWCEARCRQRAPHPALGASHAHHPTCCGTAAPSAD